MKCGSKKKQTMKTRREDEMKTEEDGLKKNLKTEEDSVPWDSIVAKDRGEGCGWQLTFCRRTVHVNMRVENRECDTPQLKSRRLLTSSTNEGNGAIKEHLAKGKMSNEQKHVTRLNADVSRWRIHQGREGLTMKC
jgi:hypothetical protein